MKEVIVILFDNFETLDVFGPVEIFGRLIDHFIVNFYSRYGGLVKSSHNVEIKSKPFSEIQSENYILLVPGGIGTRELVKNNDFIEELKKISKKAEFILTICTGSILFSKTGFLKNKKATSNKRAFFWTKIESSDVNWIKKARWIKDSNIYTSSGVSAGIDMTLGFISDYIDYETAKQQSEEIEYEWHEDSSWDPFSDLYE